MLGMTMSMASERVVAASGGGGGFTPLPGATVGYDFIAGVGTSPLSSLMDPTHTAAIGPLLTILQGTDVSIVLALKVTGSNPVGTIWITVGTFKVFAALSDTTFRTLKIAASLPTALGSGAFSTNTTKLGFSSDGTGRSLVGNNGTLVSDFQTWVPSQIPAFVNVDTQWARIDVFPSRISDVTLAADTV